MKKKGFTLIELLAVIVVLSVILVVAVPKIIDIIERADKKAYENSVNLMVEAARIDYQTKNVKGEEISLPVTYIYEENEQINKEEVGELKFKGDKAYSGIITINEKGKIIVENLVSKNKKWCAVKEEGETEAKVGKASELGCIVGEEEKIEDKKACELEKEIIEGIEVYYIDSESDLYELSKEVNSGTNFSGKIVKLRNNLDMSNVKNKCGEEDFEPIGTSSNPFKGTFEGNAKTISNLEINKPDQDNVGLFGYNVGIIKGLTLENIEITGKNNVGGIEGVSAGGKVNEVIVRGNITGTANYTGGVAGDSLGGVITSPVVNVNVTGPIANGIAGYYYGEPKGIMEGGTASYYAQGYYSDSVTAARYQGTIYSSNALGNINCYENAIDTWIGGDDDDSGYYFDYNSKGELVIKSIEKEPITFNLKGSGTEADPYLIGSYQDWKEATTKADQVGVVFKLTSDIDFSGKNFYILGSIQNKFSGILDGDGHKLKGIETKGGNYQGIIGYMDSSTAVVKNLTVENMNIKYITNYSGNLVGYINAGTVENINMNNITMEASQDYIGGLTSYNRGTITGINLKDVEITGRGNVGGIAGVNIGNINEITVRGNITGTANYTGGVAGDSLGGVITSPVVNVNVTGPIANGIAGYYYGEPKGIMEGGTASYYAQGYYSDSVTAARYQGTRFDSKYVNDLTYYDSLLDSSNNPIIESKYTGDVNRTGYFFDYGSDGKIYVVKAYEYNKGTAEVDENYTMTYIAEGASDQTAPECTLDYVVAVTNGIRASFSCTDESGTPTITSLFDSTTSLAASTYEDIGTNKNGVVNGNTRSVVSTWTTNDPVSVPARGKCYYFRYGGRDAAGNYSTYVTKKCYTAFSN